MRIAHNKPNLSGQKFGRLTVVSESSVRKHSKAHWNCVCECGGSVTAPTGALRSGKTRSCGCLLTAAITRHGMHKTSEYVVWQQMKERCHNPRKASYARYGALGIEVCERWRNDFTAFIADMGRRPSPQHTIERVDNSRGYEPDNCKWATWHEQYRNRRQTVWHELDGRRLCQEDWAREYGVNAGTLGARLRNGWDLKTALTAPAFYDFKRKGPYRP